MFFNRTRDDLCLDPEEPEMMDAVGIQQLGSACVKETSSAGAESLAQLVCNFHKGQSPCSECI